MSRTMPTRLARKLRMRLDPDSTAFNRYAACVGILIVSVPALMLIPYGLFVRGFLPTDAIGPYVWPVVGMFGLLALSVLFPKLAVTIDLRTRSGLKQYALIVCGTLIGALLGLGAVGSLPYLLHIGSQPASTQLRVTVAAVHYGSYSRRRFCGNEVVFVGDRALWRRHLCNVDRGLLASLAPGNVLVLTGTRSRYGFLVSGVAKAPRPTSGW